MPARRMARLASKRLQALLGIVAVLASFAATPASAAVKQLSAGVTLPQPFGLAATSLDRPVGVAARGWLEGPSFPGESVEISFAFEYLPFQFQNTNGAGDIKLNLNMISALAGVTLWGGPTLLGIRPYMSGQIGLLYDWLTIPNSGSSISNTGTAFAMRAAPGLDIPVIGPLGLMVELPITVGFFKPALSIWQSTFMLRWKL